MDDELAEFEVGELDLAGGFVGLEARRQDGPGGRLVGTRLEQGAEAPRINLGAFVEVNNQPLGRAKLEVNAVEFVTSLTKGLGVIVELGQGPGDPIIAVGAQGGDTRLHLGAELPELCPGHEDGFSEFGGAGGHRGGGGLELLGFLAEVLDAVKDLAHGDRGVCGRLGGARLDGCVGWVLG